jgi:DNA-binding transcriptional LysR family regulator
MDLRKVKCFIEVARLKSFSKAAQVLYISQTAVSQQIAGLEEDLGAVLFYRDKKNVRLTAAGRVFFHESKRILRLCENVAQKTREAAEGSDGMIKIGFFSMFDRSVVAPVLSSFHRTYNNVKLNIVQCSYRDMKSNLLNGTIDIGFTFLISSEELAELKIYRTFPKLCVSTANRLAEKKIINPEDIKDEHIISYLKNKEQIAYYDTYHDKTTPPTNTDKRILVENMDDAVMMVSINGGICFLPDLTAIVNPEKIVFIDQNIEKIPFDINAYWNKDNKNPVLQTFLDEIKENFVSENNSPLVG